jgi:hypothetical protein
VTSAAGEIHFSGASTFGDHRRHRAASGQHGALGNATTRVDTATCFMDTATPRRLADRAEWRPGNRTGSVT